MFDVVGTLRLIRYTCLVLSWNPLVQNCSPLYEADWSLGRFILSKWYVSLWLSKTLMNLYQRIFWTPFRSMMWIIWSRCECQRKAEVGVTLHSWKPPTIKAAFHVLCQYEPYWKQKALWGSMVSLKGHSRLLREEIKNMGKIPASNQGNFLWLVSQD